MLESKCDPETSTIFLKTKRCLIIYLFIFLQRKKRFGLDGIVKNSFFFSKMKIAPSRQSIININISYKFIKYDLKSEIGVK